MNNNQVCLKIRFLKKVCKKLDAFSKIQNTKYLNNLSVNSI